MQGTCRLCQRKTDDLWNLTIAKIEGEMINGQRFRMDLCPLCLPKIHEDISAVKERMAKRVRRSGKLMDKAFGSSNNVPGHMISNDKRRIS